MRITANQVTMARIFLLPLPVAMLLYGEEVSWWLAFVIFVFLGATDFVDGLMARKEGPTRLGSLIDPVADKIFIAAVFMTFSAIGIFPAWVVSALISRELLLTALRSSIAIRKESMKTSNLGKLKTIVQMGGSGTMFFTIALPPMWGFYLCLMLAIPFLATEIWYRAKKKRPPFWASPVFIAFVIEALATLLVSKESNLMLQIFLIVGITWISAIDYLVGSYRIFKRTGMVRGDWSRLLWAFTYGVFVSPLVAYYPIMVLPLLVSISLELGLGGIDNIVVAEKGIFYSLPFVISSVAGLIFAAIINMTIYLGLNNIEPLYVSIILASISSIICGASFGRHVDLFKRVLS